MSVASSVIICVESHPKEIEKNQMLQLSTRFFNKQTLTLMEVSNIYMTITSLNDGHIAWPLEVIRKNTSGFDIGIGTKYFKTGHDYLVRVSNNYNLSPSASTTFTIKEEKEFVFEDDDMSIILNSKNTCKLQFTYPLENPKQI